MFLVSYVRQGTYMKKVALLFLVKGHTKNNAYRKFNFLKQKKDGKDIWTVVELNVAPTKWNKEFIDLLQLINEHVKAWTKASTIIIKTLWSALFSATRFFSVRRQQSLHQFQTTGVPWCGCWGVLFLFSQQVKQNVFWSLSQGPSEGHPEHVALSR